MGASWKNTIAQRCLCSAKILPPHRSPTHGVIARLVRTSALGRVIQYSETVVVKSTGCGVLDSPPFAGDEDG
ncbi:hypothetical protein ACVWY3_004371 [Bradyrhizobium sp. USDA 4486]